MARFSRRSFLKSLGWVTGASLLQSFRVTAKPAASRVVTVTDGRAWAGPGWSDPDLDAPTVKAMLKKALTDLTGQPDSSSALAALIPGLNPDQRIGIKVNCVNAHLPSHPNLATTLIDLLITAGATPGNIIVFDRTDWELAACGYPQSTGTDHRVCGSDHLGIGYDDPFVVGGDQSVRLSKIVTSEIDHLINIPVLKHHEMAGVTLSLKNHYGSIDAPDRLHGVDRDCCPGIAELSNHPKIRDATRLILIDALFGSYRSGLGARPDFAPMSLIAATDPVAADTVGQDLINARRKKDNLGPLDARHIHQAASQGLGSNDLSSIERLDTVENPVTEKPKPWEKSGSNGCNSNPGSGKSLAAGLAGAGALAYRGLRIRS